MAPRPGGAYERGNRGVRVRAYERGNRGVRHGYGVQTKRASAQIPVAPPDELLVTRST